MSDRIGVSFGFVLGVGLGLAAPPAAAAVVERASAPSLVTGADGRGIFAYQDLDGLDLRVAHCVDAACTNVTTSTLDSAGDVGANASIAIGSGGLPVVAYEDRSNRRLRLALCADTACTSASTVVLDDDFDNFGLVQPAVALIGTDARPLVVYGHGVLFGVQLKAAHCDDAACTSVTVSALGQFNIPFAFDAAMGGDGRAAIVTSGVFGLAPLVTFHRCNDAACTALTSNPGQPGGLASIAMSPAGLPVYAAENGAQPLQVVRCADAQCTTSSTLTLPAQHGHSQIAVDASDRPRVAFGRFSPIVDVRVAACADASCSTHTDSCVAAVGMNASMALDSSGDPLVAFELGDRVEVRGAGPTDCPRILAAYGRRQLESEFDPDGGPFEVWLGPASKDPVTVSYQTFDGTALAGLDYLPTSGVLTFAPGEVRRRVNVPFLDDVIGEPEERFELRLSSPNGAALADAVAIGTIVDDDPPLPEVSVSDCQALETGGACAFEVSLSHDIFVSTFVDYATADGSAAAGSDYVARTGTLTFTQGSLTRTVTVSVLDDVVPERDETFFLNLSNLVYADPGDVTGLGTIVDDDSPSLSTIELAHGAALRGTVAPAPGPVPDRDDYRLAQSPFASYEVVLDEASGDAAPGLHLERIAATGSLLQSGQPTGTGTASAMRFENRFTVPLLGQYVRVAGASCGTGCTANDTYRVRVYETTGRIARYNNSAGQATVLVLQNTLAEPVSGHADFWLENGEHAGTYAFTLGPHETGATFPGNVLPATIGTKGSITVTHDGGYNAIAGKAVALQPSTGFSFDTPMHTRPR